MQARIFHKLKDCPKLIGYSRSTIYEKQTDPDFPRIVDLGPRNKGMWDDEIRAYQDRCAAASIKEAA